MDCEENFWTDLIKTIHINHKKLKTTFNRNLVVFQDKKSVMHQKIFLSGWKVRLGTPGWHFGSFIGEGEPNVWGKTDLKFMVVADFLYNNDNSTKAAMHRDTIKYTPCCNKLVLPISL